MYKNIFSFLVTIAILLALSGCTSPGINEKIGSVPESDNNETEVGSENISASGTGTIAEQGAGKMPAGDDGIGAEAGLKLKEWKAPDGSITLQVPEGWNAAEKRIDNCTVNWNVEDPTSAKSAYMNNQIMVLKSEQAREMYKAYGLQGIDNVPVSDYLLPEQAVSRIVAPLGGSSNVQIVERDNELTQQVYNAYCITGLAACNALVFDATYDNNGRAMKGKYFAVTLDLGEGTTWWINLWGYTSPVGEWEESGGLLEKVFTSVMYTEEWQSKCRKNAESTIGVINEVIKNRQAASQDSAEQWSQYIRN